MITNRAGHFVFVSTVLAAAVTLGACAQQGAPQGGPPDTTPPTVDLTVPGSADVLVPHDHGLSLQFSEPIEQASLETGYTLSPSRGGIPEFKWSNGSRRVDITWADSLRDSTTYRVTLSNRVSDRRGNKLAEPYTFAFSTGNHVDRGEIRGRIRSKDAKQESFDVFAYRAESMPDTFWLSPPDYATQTGADSRLHLPFLRAGQYRLLALTDGNRNQRLDHGELFALATHDLTVGDEIPADSIELFPTVYDTVPFTLKSCAAVGPRQIALAFSHPLDTANSSEWKISAYDSASGEAINPTRLGPTLRRNSTITLLADWVDGRTYTISAQGMWDQRGHQVLIDSCHCVYAAPVDSIPPRIEFVFTPTLADGLTASDAIRWIFSEPVDTAKLAGAVSVRDTSGVALQGAQAWHDLQTLSFSPAETWPDTVDIVATIDSSRIADAQGNVAGAGIYRWQFRPIGPGSLGAVEGRTETPLSSLSDYWIEAQELGKSRSTRIRLSGPGQFTLNLPAGRWQLGGFVDSDGDGHWSPGSLEPFSTPELRAIPSDTLDVRARFTLEEIILRF